MSAINSRKKNSRFYWAELGFLALGLLGINPNLLTDLLVGPTPRPTNTAPPASTPQAWQYPQSQTGYYASSGYAYPSTNPQNGYNSLYSTPFESTGYRDTTGYRFPASDSTSSVTQIADVILATAKQLVNQQFQYNQQQPNTQQYSNGQFNSWANDNYSNTNSGASNNAPNYSVASNHYPSTQTVPPANYNQNSYNSGYQNLTSQMPTTSQNNNTASLSHGYPSNYTTIANQAPYQANSPYQDQYQYGTALNTQAQSYPYTANNNPQFGIGNSQLTNTNTRNSLPSNRTNSGAQQDPRYYANNPQFPTQPLPLSQPQNGQANFPSTNPNNQGYGNQSGTLLRY